MTWIALSDAKSADWNPAGIAPAGRARANLPVPADDDLMPVGTLVFEVALGPDPVSLIEMAVCNSWPRALSIRLHPEGRLELRQSAGNEARKARLECTLRPGDRLARISLAWDAPRRRGSLTLKLPDRAAVFQTALRDPLPLWSADLHGSLMSDLHRHRAPGPLFSALSDRVEPAGTMPGLLHGTPIDTPDGPVPIEALAPGDLVTTHDAGPLPVLWAGYRDVPARGRFRPVRLRAPYFGCQRDVLVAETQLVLLDGPDVEYLFGEEEVFVAARNLIDGVTALHETRSATVRYHQILLDRHEVISAAGCATESLFSGWRELGSPAASDLPEVAHDRTARTVLRGFEALTLNTMRAA